MAKALTQIRPLTEMSAIDRGAGIYMITFRDKIYVGSAVNLAKRWSNHAGALALGRHHSAPLQAAYNKHPTDVVKFEILERVDNRALLIEREQYWLDTLRPFEFGYNVCATAGSKIGVPLSESHREKISAAGRGRRHTPEARARMSAAMRGKPKSVAHKAALAAANIGKTASAETRAKLSAANRGKRLSPEHRAKLSAWRTGRKFPSRSAETRARMSASQKLRRAK